MKSIRAKILITFISASVLALSSCWLLFSLRAKSFIEEYTNALMKKTAKVVLENITREKEAGFSEMYQKIVLYSRLSDAKISLIDENGKVWFDSDIPVDKIHTIENYFHFDEIVRARKDKSSSRTRNKMMYYVERLSPPRSIGAVNHIGYIRIGYPLGEIESIKSVVNQIIALAVVLSVVIILFFSFRISKSISKPIGTLVNATRDIGKGNFEFSLPERTSKDEIGKLSESFYLMQNALKEYINNLQETTSAKEKIESELKTAKEIQESMLPRLFPPFPERNDIDIYAMIEPAKQVGGDFYDFFFIDKNRLFITIGDVSDKGVPSALFMVIIKTLLKNEALNGLSPIEILSKVNNIIYADNRAGMFATVFLAILDTETGELQFGNAGHNPPLISLKGEDFKYLSIESGFVLGIMQNIRFGQGNLTLNPGDALLLYTDGVTEAMNRELKLFSTQKLQKILVNLKNQEAIEVVKGIRLELNHFVQNHPQSDDITMCVLNYLGR